MPIPFSRKPDVAAVKEPIEVFAIAEILKELKSGSVWEDEDRHSKLLFNGVGMRVVLVAMHKGAIIQSHKADCALSLLVLEGRLRFQTEGESPELEHGRLLTLEPGIRHGIEALTETSFILFLASDQSHPAQP